MLYLQPIEWLTRLDINPEIFIVITVGAIVTFFTIVLFVLLV